MSDFFKTLSSPAEGIYKDKLSKFLSFAHPVETAEEAKAYGLIDQVIAYKTDKKED